MSQSFVIQVGQCGNQIGCQFWDMALREHANVNKKAIYNEALSTFFRNVNSKSTKEYSVGNGKNKIFNLKARALLIDMEEGVVNQLLKGPMGEVFDCKQLLTSQSGSGNNWAVGNKYYGKRYGEVLRELIRKAVEKCDHLQTFFIIHSMGGGTGSGIGTLILKMLAEDYPDIYRFAITVYPSADDDVITSPYNSILAMKELTYADCVMPVDNKALLDICNRINLASDKLQSRSGSTSVRSALSRGSSQTETKPFAQMNNIVANLILNLTSSSRFEGSMNVDLNEIASNLIPFPRLNYVMSNMAPIYGLMDVGIPVRTVDNMFSEAFSSNSRLLSFDPSEGLYLASALLLRGNISITNIRQNIDKLQTRLKFVSWNQEGWKTGLCSVPPIGNPYSLLALSNNTSVQSIFQNLNQRFMLLYKRKAHVHHYLQVDEMEYEDFESSIMSVTDLIAEYQEIELNSSRAIPPPLQVVM